MTEIKADLYQEQVLNRKEFLQNKYKDCLNNSNGGVARRQKIFLSEHADSLSDEELISHKRELSQRKIFSFVSFFLIPGALVGFKYNVRALVLSVVPSFFLAKNVYNASFLNKKCAYSVNMAENSQNRFLEKILRFNNKRFSSIQDMVSSPPDAVPVKDWIARNEYR
jgi:hypothetical protein